MNFPIYKKELKKFIFLSIIFLLISFNHSLIRGIKDMFILTNSDASTIYYLKLFCVTPSLILFAILYASITKKLNRNGRFNIVFLYFAIFFTFFLFVVYPNLEKLKLDYIYLKLKNSYPRLIGFWSLIKNWHTSLFYIHAEAWGSYALGVAFWTLANDITSLQQSKRFYSILAIFSNIGGMSAGLALSYVFKGNFYFSLLTCVSFIFLTLLIYKFLSKDIEKNPGVYEIKIQDKKKPSIKLSFFESVKLIFKSNYLMLIAFLVFSYGLCISLFEALWKNNLQLFSAGDKDLLAKIYGYQITYIGVTSIFLSIFLFPAIIKRGWKFMAFFTPISFLFSTLVFFSLIFWGNKFNFLSHWFNTSTLGLTVLIGLMNIVFIKAAKFSFFDVSKEAAYIPLDENSKVRSKAAVDGIGLVFGKGMGAVLVTVLSFFSPNGIYGIKHYLALFIVIFLILWLLAINNLSKKFKANGGESFNING